MNRYVVLVIAVLPLLTQAQNVADGKDVYGPCAACHGANGEGGKGGEYPRIAGQPAAFTIASLISFQSRKRNNIPMFPYTEPRELSERDMKDVAAFLETIKLPTKVPEFKDSDSALDRLLAMERVLIVPRVEGDIANGKATYKRERCGSCHGDTGLGNPKKGGPRLVGQYPNYLQRQIDAFRKGERGTDKDDPMNGVLSKLTPQEITDVLAWLTSIQDRDTEADDATAP